MGLLLQVTTSTSLRLVHQMLPFQMPPVLPRVKNQMCIRDSQATLIANNIQHNKIRRSGKSDGRCLYNGGTILVDDSEHYFTGGFHPKDYVKAACWENTEGYKLGESFGDVYKRHVVMQ